MKVEEFLKRQYKLEGNPFQDKAARDEWLETWVNRDAELKQWRKVLSTASQGNTNQIVFIVGQYGIGKTLSLLKIVQDAGEENGIERFYLNFQGEQKSKNPGLDLLFRLLKTLIYSQRLESTPKKKIEESLSQFPESLFEVRDVLRGFFLGDESLRQLSGYFVSGQMKPSRSDLKSLGILRKIDDVEIGKEYLAGLLLLLKRHGAKSILFAIDEFEYLFSLIPKSQRTIYLALLRGLYDFPLGVPVAQVDVAKLTMFIAISQDGWRMLGDMEEQEREQGGPIQPLMRRVTLTSTLNPFTKKETRELIQQRLSYDRVRGVSKSKPLIPFTEDFVDFVFEEGRGELSRTIDICDHVLDAGIERAVSPLNKRFAKTVMADRNL